MCLDPSRLVWPTVAVEFAGQSYVAVDGHRHQCMPALPFDVLHVPDRDVAHPDTGIALDVVDVGQLRRDGVCTGALALRSWQRQRIGARASRSPTPRELPEARAHERHSHAGSLPRSRWCHHPLQTLRGVGVVGLGNRLRLGRQRQRSVRIRRRLGRNVVGSHPILGVGQLIGARHRPDDRVDSQSVGSSFDGS